LVKLSVKMPKLPSNNQIISVFWIFSLNWCSSCKSYLWLCTLCSLGQWLQHWTEIQCSQCNCSCSLHNALALQCHDVLQLTT